MKLNGLRVAALFLLFAAVLPSFAQTSTGAINGSVTDPTGAVVPDSPVTLLNTATGAKQQTKASASGVFHFELLDVGTYRVTAAPQGFSETTVVVPVKLGQVSVADIKLSVASASQTVNVQSEALELQTENGNVSTTISTAQIQEIPNSGNDLTYVVQLAPGTVVNNQAGGKVVYGLPNSTSTYTMDGMVNDDPYYNGNNSGATNLLLGSSEVEEATVAGNAYSGQYGGLSGAQVNYVTRGGQNRIHGSAVWYWAGKSTSANDWFNNNAGVPRSDENANQWSAELGGPVKKDKLFYYVDTEGIRMILPTSQLTVVPSPQFQTAALANLQATGLGKSIPFYQNMFNLYNGAPGIGGAKPGNGQGDLLGCGSFVGPAGLGTSTPCTDYIRSTVSNYANEWTLATRADYTMSESDRGFIRFQTDHGIQPSNTDPINPIFNAISPQPFFQGQINETHSFGTRAVNSVVIAGGWYSAQFSPANLTATLAAFPTQMNLSDGTLTTLGGEDGTFPVGRNVTTVQLQDDFLFYKGNHTFKVGGRWNLDRINDHYFTLGTNGTLSPSTLGAFFYGGTDPSGDNTVYTKRFSTGSNYPLEYWQLGIYGEDEWKATPTLTLTAALRIDHPTIPDCLQNCFTRMVDPFPQLDHDATIPYSQALDANVGNALSGLQAVEWQPRASFAWSPAAFQGRTVVRGGAGIFFDAFPVAVLDVLAQSPPNSQNFTVSGDNIAQTETTNLFSDATQLNTAFVSGFENGQTVGTIKAGLPASLQPFFSPPIASSTEKNTRVYQIYKWNMEVQQSFPHDLIISINYVGNHGIHKAFPNTGLNAFDPGFAGLPSTVPDARFGKVYYLQTDGNSSYNGLISTITKRFGSAGTVQASYTWSHTMDDFSGGLTRSTTASNGGDISSVVDPYHPNATYGSSANNIPVYFMLNYVYKTQFHNFFIGGWQVAGALFAHEGSPFSIIDSNDTAKLSANNYGGTLLANYLGGSLPKCSGRENVLTTCLPPTSFSPASAGFGDAPRNAFRGPNYFDTDLSLLKDIPLPMEGMRFQLGAQFFNVLNHPNFANPNTNISSSAFGLISGSQGTPTSLFSGIGGDSAPRLIQFKAKFIF
jgi:hypothetical protein